jgi:hypothetical protein
MTASDNARRFQRDAIMVTRANVYSLPNTDRDLYQANVEETKYKYLATRGDQL